MIEPTGETPPTENVDQRTQAFLQRESSRLLHKFAFNMTVGPAVTTAIVAPLQHIVAGFPTEQSLLIGAVEGITLGILFTVGDIRALGKKK